MSLRPHAWWLPAAAAALLWNGVSEANLFDTGELVAAAWTLGGSHAPGQPLHALLGRFAALVPMGPIPWRMTAVSTLGALAAAWLTGRLAGLVLEQLTDRRGLLVRAVPDAAALGVLLAPPLLRQAARPEVYAPAAALTIGAFVLLWRWGVRAPGAGVSLRRAALATGLAATLHPPHALAVVAVAIVVLLALRLDVLRRPRSAAWAALFGLFGLVAYAYLPIRGAAGATMWGEPTTLEGFARYVTASAYQGNLGGGDASFGHTVVDVLRHLVRSSGFVPLAGIVALGVLAGRSPGRRRRVLPLLACPLVASGAAMLQPLEIPNPDNVAYLVPALAWLVATGAAGIGVLTLTSWGRALAAVALVPLAFNPVGLLAAPSVVRADSPALMTLSTLYTHTPPPRALVVLETDSPATTWWAARSVEGARPDAGLFVTGLATSSWHWRELASHPAFDGRPVRAPAEELRQSYVRGAVIAARRATAVASEPRNAVGSQGMLAGPYLVVAPEGRGESTRVDRDGMAERLAPYLDVQAAFGVEGDHRAAGNVIRTYQTERVRRLLARRAFEPAFDQLARALPELPHAIREHVRKTRGPLVRPPPPVVRDPTAFMSTPGDVAREAAALLWAARDARGALELLETQMERGDARALLQLAWMHAHAGRADLARLALSQFLRAAPALADEAEPLVARLDGRGGSP